MKVGPASGGVTPIPSPPAAGVSWQLDWPLVLAGVGVAGAALLLLLVWAASRVVSS